MTTPDTVDCSGVLLIQGDAGTGKTTICEWIVPALAAKFYDTGNIWRGITAYANERGYSYTSVVECWDLAQRLRYNEIEGRSFVCGLDVTDALRSETTTSLVSQYAGVKVLREAFTRAAQQWISCRPAVVSGRHLHEIFPKAPLCLHIERELEESKSFRLGQPGDGNAHLVQSRRLLDAQNAAVAGVGLEDVTYLDVTGMTKYQQAAAVLHLADEVGFEVDFTRIGHGQH